jgi:hypothetical protein
MCTCKNLGFPAPLIQAETYLTRAFKPPSVSTICSARFAAKSRYLKHIHTKAYAAQAS